MNCFQYKYAILLFLLLLLLSICDIIIQYNKYQWSTKIKKYTSFLNVHSIIHIFQTKTTIINYTVISTTATTMVSTTSTTHTSTTIDPAKLLVERPPSVFEQPDNISDTTLAVFIFHIHHSTLVNLQLYLIRKLTTNLIAVELFLDGSVSEEIRQVADLHHAGLHCFPSNMHSTNARSSNRNAAVVNWAIRTLGKAYLQNGTAILLLDGDVFPLSTFDSRTLLNSRDIVCRKHPGLYSRFCWIGFICLSPTLYSTMDDFSVSTHVREGSSYDAGGRTIEYLLKYQNMSFSWMKETILLENDKELFWGAFNNDITWIQENFHRCDKCGPEIFFSPFNNSNAVFYHMISGTSEWRFENQTLRRQSLYESIMKSAYGLNRTNEFKQASTIAQLNASVRKIQNMRLIPFHGNLTCESICKG